MSPISLWRVCHLKQSFEWALNRRRKSRTIQRRQFACLVNSADRLRVIVRALIITSSFSIIRRDVSDVPCPIDWANIVCQTTEQCELFQRSYQCDTWQVDSSNSWNRENELKVKSGTISRANWLKVKVVANIVVRQSDSHRSNKRRTMPQKRIESIKWACWWWGVSSLI